MAQWIARRTSNPEAVGSSPTGDVARFKDYDRQYAVLLGILNDELHKDSV